MTLIFDPSRSSKVKFDGANRKPVGLTDKCSRGVQPRMCHRFRDVSSQTFDSLRHRKIFTTPATTVYNTGCHRPCGGQFFTLHTVRSCPASLSHRANDRRTCYQFFNFWPWGAYPWSKGHQNLLSTIKFQPDRANDLRDMRYQSFSLFG